IKKINSELERYSPELAARPQIFAANKVDSHDPDLVDLSALEAYIKDELGCELFYISAATRQGVDELMWRTAEMLSDLPPLTIYESEEAPLPEISEDGEREIIVHNINGVYHVEGEWLLQLIDSVNFGDRESVAFFQRILKSSGVIDALTAKGCEDGDTVNIYDIEFEFIS
ncbi:MAG: Obg family GTPase CgtA, partial [Clostridia bacterium]|nr:Obg family GTPase CgtA [Clostridia bacterium]